MERGQRSHSHAASQLKSSSSSTQIAVLNDDDLLTLILLHVPWKKLMSLKCVSRQWLSLIANPHFIGLRTLHPLRTSAFLAKIPYGCLTDKKVYFVDLDDPKPPSPFSVNDPFDPQRVPILQSCNGLVLFCTDPDKSNFYVCNTCTNQVDPLPKHPCRNNWRISFINLAYDPRKSLHYKVIAFLDRPRSRPGDPVVGDFYVYSSETGNWRASLKSCYPAPGMWFTKGVYWNGGLHWLNQYSESHPHPDCFYFNVDEERLKTFPGPPVSVNTRGPSYFGESEGHLHYAEVCPYDPSFNVYEMKSDYSGWFVKYQIDLVPVSKAFPIMKECACYSGESFNAAVALLVRRENFKEASFLVLEVPGQIIHYNLVDRSFKAIWNFAVDLEEQTCLHWYCGDFKAWPCNQ